MAVTRINPYEPPGDEHGLGNDTGSRLPILPERRWNEVEVAVVSIERGWWKRCIRLEGSLDTEIRYEAAGHGERVYVNGGLIVTTPVFHLAIVYPHVGFYLEGLGHRIPASIDVACSVWRLLQISTFRLSVAGEVVYEE